MTKGGFIMNTSKKILLGSVCLLTLGLTTSISANASGDRNTIETPREVVKKPDIDANFVIKTTDEKPSLPAPVATGNAEIDDINTEAYELSKKRANVNTTIGLNIGGDEKLDSSSEKFLKSLADCSKLEITSKSTMNTDKKSTKSVLGLDSDNNCVVKEDSITCRFPQSKLSEIVAFYRKKLSGSINGQYNIGVDMKMPEIKFKEMSDDDLDFNFKLELPKIKFDKVKTSIETLIEESCK